MICLAKSSPLPLDPQTTTQYTHTLSLSFPVCTPFALKHKQSTTNEKLTCLVG